MKRELDEIAGGKMISGHFGPPLPPEIEEKFLEQVLAYERAEFDTNFNRLVQRGLSLPPAVELDDHSLTTKLMEIIRELAEMRCFLEDTDHLSDRELYHWLWSDGLREETADLSALEDGAWHTSPIGACSEEDTKIWLKYYADEEDRQRWHRDFPSDPIPEHQSLPFDRDRYLPKPHRF
jgi:hypothetical protein